MSDTEDPTKKYPSPEDYKTNPMLETILAEMRAGFISVNQRLDNVETEISGIKAEQGKSKGDLRE